MKTLLKDGMIVTMNSRKEILENSDLLIEEDRIQRLFPGTAYSGSDVHHVIDCQGKIILHGVTTVLNMFTMPSKEPLKGVNAACQAFLDTGIRGTLALSLKDQSPDDTG